MPVIMHALPEADWAAAKRAGEYSPDSLDDQGYIPFHEPEEVVDHVNERFADQERDDIGVVVVHTEGFGDRLSYEGDDGREQPRLYGSLAPESVTEWGHFPRDGHGFHLPSWAVDMVDPGRLPEETEGEFR